MSMHCGIAPSRSSPASDSDSQILARAGADGECAGAAPVLCTAFLRRRVNEESADDRGAAVGNDADRDVAGDPPDPILAVLEARERLRIQERPSHSVMDL